MTFPAFTICSEKDYIQNITSNILSFKFNKKEFDLNDFLEIFTIYDEIPTYLHCAQINGAKVKKNKLLATNALGYMGGYTFDMLIPTNIEVNYFIGDNFIKPEFTDFYGVIQGGSTTYITIDKEKTLS